MIDIEQDGEDLLAELPELESNLKTKAVRAGLLRGMRPLKRALQVNAPRSRGDLAKAIGHRTLTPTDRIVLMMGPSVRNALSLGADQQAVLVGPNKKVRGYNQAFKGTMTEFGVDRHLIRPRKKNLHQSLRLRGGAWVKQVIHPGVKPQYWMAESLAQSQSEIDQGFYDGLARFLDKQR